LIFVLLNAPAVSGGHSSLDVPAMLAVTQVVYKKFLDKIAQEVENPEKSI
jgi:hypothetical protein